MNKRLDTYFKGIHKRSPIWLQSMLSKTGYLFNKRPRIKKETQRESCFPGMDNGYKGCMVISADFELGWAFRFSKKNPYPEKNAKRTRDNFPFLIDLFEKYQIPITWATVGHLFLTECKKGDHDWMRRIPYFENKNWIYDKGDWFDCDPYTEWSNADTWYAPDLIESIVESKVPHEIACHTFSHIDFSDKNCPPEVAEDELRACVEAAKKWDVTLNSIVFPGGTFGNFQILKNFGFKTYRKKLDHDLACPFKDKHGLLVLPSSVGLGDNGYGWNAEYFVKILCKYIDKSVSSGTVCHFWFHPSFSLWFLKEVFPKVLKYSANKREEGKLHIATMEEFVATT